MKQNKKSYGSTVQKVLAIACMLCLLLSFGAVAFEASAAGNAEIRVSSDTVERKDSASISFKIVENPGIWGFKFRIHYDHTAMTLKSVTFGSIFNEGEFAMSESLNSDPYVVTACGNALADKTVDGKIFTLNFTVKNNAEFKTYPVTVEIVQVINVAGENVELSAVNGSIKVVKCLHSNTEWKVTTPASWEQAGTETLTCTDCNETFETREITPTGHQHTEIRNAAEATTAAEGYTGDIYCTDCGALISAGSVIPKIDDGSDIPDPPIDSDGDAEPEMTTGTNLTYVENSGSPLVFVSDADFSKFVRVEIDGAVLAAENYEAKSGSTVITINADYLNTLSEGTHSVSIVSKNGTASAQFTVQKAAQPIEPPEETDEGSLTTIIIIVVLVLLIGGVAAYVVIKKRRVR